MYMMQDIVNPKIVAAGIDSLNIGFNINKFLLDKATVKRLDESKIAAREKLFGWKNITVELAGREFNMLARGSKGYEYVMHNEDIRLCMAKECQGGRVMPEVFVQLNSVFLWGEGYNHAYRKVRDFIGQFAVIDSEKVNRVDLCVDLEIKLPVIDVKREIVTRSRKKVDYFQAENYTDGLRDTGYRFGDGDMMARIYDKGFEIKHSEKSWFPDIWKLGGHDGTSPVTRVEGQFRRPLLKDMSVNSYSELIERTPDIWRVFTNEFITLRVPNNNDSNHRRWEISPFWETVQSAGSRFGEYLGVQRWKQKQARVEPLMAQLKGLMVSVVALDSTVRGVDFAKSRLLSDVKNYMESEAFQIKVIERSGRYSNM